jgi:hypothetical protein
MAYLTALDAENLGHLGDEHRREHPASFYR